jgi:hypothetical protein
LSSITERFLVQAVSFPGVKERGFTAETVLATLTPVLLRHRAGTPIRGDGRVSKFIPVSNIVFGTDYPYRTSAEQAKGLAEIFSSADLRASNATTPCESSRHEGCIAASQAGSASDAASVRSGGNRPSRSGPST